MPHASNKTVGIPITAASRCLSSAISQMGVTSASEARTAAPIQYWKYHTIDHVEQIGCDSP
jgi:hypothetical protein